MQDLVVEKFIDTASSTTKKVLLHVDFDLILIYNKIFYWKPNMKLTE